MQSYFDSFTFKGEFKEESIQEKILIYYCICFYIDEILDYDQGFNFLFSSFTIYENSMIE